MVESLPTAWFLTGPTAAGKTAVGIELARQIGAEIISLDSMALYRGMDIGTAKPSIKEQGTVPHYLIDILKPSQEFSVAQYLENATAASQDISARGKQVLFVGGTALYLKALLRGLFSGPTADWKLRSELEEFARVDGPAALHNRLKEVDPVAAAKLHPNDVRRIIRALEVHQTTGQAISTLQQQFDRSRPASECRVFVLDWPRQQLDQRIRQRVDEMFAAGLVDEVRRLLSDTSPDTPEAALSRTASQAVGYKEVLDFLEDERDLPSIIERVKLRTRQFAKRQLTWYRSLSECRWIAMQEPLEPQTVARQIMTIGQNSKA
jgi:tRNA dimethylallyltransferase